MLSEHVPSLVGILPVQSAMAHILYILQGCGLFLYLFTGFTRAFGRISRGSHFYVLLKEYVITKMNKTMMKIGRFAITIMALMTAVSVSAQDFDKKNLLYRVSSAENKTVELVGFEKKPKEELLIPDEVSYKGDKYIITSIAENAFKDCENLKSVIGSTIQQIKDGAFQGCINLSSATFTDQLSEVKNNAFQGCTSLSQVSLGNNVQTIGDAAFQNCSSLTEFSFGSGLKSLGKGVINGTKISSIVLPNSLVKIGHHAFADCNQLSSVTFGNALTHIENNAFEKTSISMIVFPNTLLKIGDKAFADCTNLQSITYGNSLDEIGAGAFQGISVSSLSFPNSLRIIGTGAYENCKELQQIILNDKIKEIGQKAFSGCSKLTVDITDETCDIKEGAFDGCKKLIDLGCSIKGIAHYLNNINCDNIRIDNFTGGFSIITYRLDNKDQTDIISKKGRVIGHQGAVVSENLVMIENDSGFVLKNNKGKTLTNYIYESCEAKYDSEGLLGVSRNGKIGYINLLGVEVIPCILNYDDYSGFHDGRAMVSKDGKDGFIDNTGKEIISCIYDEACDFCEGLARVKKNEKWGFIDVNGKEIIQCIYSDLNDFCEGLATAKKDDDYYVLDKTGKVLFSLEKDVSIEDSFSEGIASVSKVIYEGDVFYTLSGYVNRSGKRLTPLIYDIAGDFHDGRAMVSYRSENDYSGKKGFIDPSGNIIIPIKYDFAYDFNEGLACVENNGKYGYIDVNNNVVIPFDYSIDYDYSEHCFSDGLTILKDSSNHFGCLDKNGKIVIPFVYDKFLRNFSDGLAIVRKSGKWGVVDTKGNSTFDYQK